MTSPKPTVEDVPELPLPRDLLAAFKFTWTDTSGAVWTTDGSLVTSYIYVGQIYRDVELVGSFSRRIFKHSDGGLGVVEIGISLDEAARERGFADEFWRASLSRYERCGIRRIKVHADDKGRKFWARYPFRFADPADPKRMLSVWQLPATLPGEAAFITEAARLGLAPAAVEAFVSRIEQKPESFTPADLWETIAGKLLLEGASWHGEALLPTGLRTQTGDAAG